MRTVHVVLNLLVMLSLLTLGLTMAYFPHHLASLHLTLLDSQLVIMQLISLLMLLAFLQKNLSTGWRLFTLTGSFVVLGESILMSGLFVK